MDPTTDQDSQLLEELRRRRAELRESMTAVEHALASASRVDDAHWAERVRAALVELSGDLREHIAITEGPDGLYLELERTAPRLSGPVEHLRGEHGDMTSALDELLGLLEPPGGVPVVDAVRRAGTDLLVALMHHRQRGADLVFQAYEFDIGGET